MDPTEAVIYLVVGLSAGVLGGLLGIGGSVIMIPVLTILLDKSQHLAQAAAMIVNVAVACPSAYRHHVANAVQWDVFRRILPAGIFMIVVGVLVSDLFTARTERTLTQIFGFFLVYVIASNILQMIHGKGSVDEEGPPPEWWRCSVVGVITGFLAGLLGIGGGIIAVPLMQRVCRMPLRHCIATSSAVMILTAVVGACLKNITLPSHDELVRDSLLIAACLIPTAVLGGLIGARLTHKLDLKWIRTVFLVLLTLAAFRMIMPSSNGDTASPIEESPAASESGEAEA